MRYIHNAQITVFYSSEEWREDLRAETGIVFHMLAPLDFEKEKISIQEEMLDGFDSRKIHKYSLLIEKESYTNVFLSTLASGLGDAQRALVMEQLDSRLDEELNFFIRLGKQEMLAGRYKLTDSGDCFHIKMSLAAFPKKRNVAARVVREIFS